MSQTLNLPILQPNQVGESRWMVVIYNNDVTPFEAVIEILMLATKCDQEEASIEAWEAHHYGQASVHFAAKDECDAIATMIENIGVKAEVKPEWND